MDARLKIVAALALLAMLAAPAIGVGRVGVAAAAEPAAITTAAHEVEARLEELKGRCPASGSDDPAICSLSIADMFEMQMLMNTLSQLSEMSSTVVAGMNAAVLSPARTIKG